MFRGAKRSTGARLGQKLVQFTCPGHAPPLQPLPFAGDFPSRQRESPIFRFIAKGSRSRDDEKKTSPSMIVELTRPSVFSGWGTLRTNDDLAQVAYL